MVQIDDEKLLIGQFKQGDHHAYKILYLTYAPKLLAFSRKYLNSAEEAEEIVQEVFLRLWEKKENVDENRSFSSYVIQAAKHRIFNGFRKKVNEKAYLDFAVFSNNPNLNLTGLEVEYNEVKRKADAAIESMPPKRQEIFKLSREKGLKNREIADKLQISIKTVENQMSQALKYLKEELVDFQVIILILLFDQISF